MVSKHKEQKRYERQSKRKSKDTEKQKRIDERLSSVSKHHFDKPPTNDMDNDRRINNFFRQLRRDVTKRRIPEA